MRAVVCRALGRPGDLAVENIPAPRPRPGEAAIRVRYAGVNFPDLLMVQGLYQHKPDLPFVPGMEVAGTVMETNLPLGAPVAAAPKPGSRVFAGVRLGGFAGIVTAPLARIRPIPEGLSDAEAAAFPVAAQTAWVALVERGRIRAGETVLVLGAGGGVGLAAVQLAAASGARAIAVASTPQKRDAARDAGAWRVLPPDGDIKAAIAPLTGGRGVDLVYDPVGGEIFDRAIRALGWGGRYLVVGFASGAIPTLAVNRALIKGLSVIGVRAGEQFRQDPAAAPRVHRAIDALAARGAMTPRIHAALPLDRAGEALEALGGREVAGKIVLAVD